MCLITLCLKKLKVELFKQLQRKANFALKKRWHIDEIFQFCLWLLLSKLEVKTCGGRLRTGLKLYQDYTRTSASMVHQET